MKTYFSAFLLALLVSCGGGGGGSSSTPTLPEGNTTKGTTQSTGLKETPPRELHKAQVLLPESLHQLQSQLLQQQLVLIIQTYQVLVRSH